VDLRLIPGAVATPIERGAIDALLGSPPSGWRERCSAARLRRTRERGPAARDRRHLLLPALQAVQSRAGWISPAPSTTSVRDDHPAGRGLRRRVVLCAAVDRASATPRGSRLRRSRLPGERRAGALFDLERRLGPAGHPRRADKRCGRRAMSRLCERAPAAFLQLAGEQPGDRSVAPATAGTILDLWLSGTRRRLLPTGARAHRPKSPHAARHRGSVNAPRQRGRTTGNSALRRVATSIRKASTTTGLTAATRAAPRLRARAGGCRSRGRRLEVDGPRWRGVPHRRKWDACQAAARPHYVVCNADESEPGTFKDRV